MDCCNHQCEACHKHKERTPAEMKALINRLNRIEGQVRGLQQMIASGRDCVETAHQIDAVIAALRRVQGDMIRDHLDALTTSIGGALPDERRRELIDEIGRLFARKS